MIIKLTKEQANSLDDLLQKNYDEIKRFYPDGGYARENFKVEDLKYSNIFDYVGKEINLTHPSTKPQFVLDFLEKEGLYKPNN